MGRHHSRAYNSKGPDCVKGVELPPYGHFLVRYSLIKKSFFEQCADSWKPEAPHTEECWVQMFSSAIARNYCENSEWNHPPLA